MRARFFNIFICPIFLFCINARGEPASDTNAGIESESEATTNPRKRTAEEEIEVLGVREAAQAISMPQSITFLDKDEELKRETGLFLEESINLVPGVRLENRTTSGGQRITIRGYGNSTNFNGTGYKAYLNGIPITDAEGATILDDIDVANLGRIDVIRGPASSLYGSGIGGVVKMYTVKPERRRTKFVEDLSGGTQALFRTNTRVEHSTDNSAVLASYARQQSDGYRIHTRSRKDFAFATADFDPNPSQSLSFYGSYNHSFEQLAGQLTEGQFLRKENVAEQAYLANDAHVAIDSLRFGASHSYQFAPSVANATSAFLSTYQLDQPFAGARNDNMALSFGGRTAFDFRFNLPSVSIDGVVGAEIQQNNSLKKGYNSAPGTARDGTPRSDLQVVSLQANVFTEWTAALPYELQLELGASLNFIHYNIRDRLSANTVPGHQDQSGIRDFDPVITPRIAVSKTFTRSLSVYAQVSQGYSAPTSGTVIIPQTGVVNRDLKPERATLYEVGTKGDLLDTRLGYQVALFDMSVTDKLTPVTVLNPNGSIAYTTTTNAGSQHDRGVELAARYAVIRNAENPISLVEPFVSYSYSRFRYDNFKSNNNNDPTTIDYSNKKVVGVPDHLLNAGLTLASRWGFYLNADYQFVDSVPLTFDNQHTAKSFSLLGAKLGYHVAIDKHFRVDAFVGGKNLLGSLYYTMVFLNQTYSSPTGQPVDPNVYLPGPYSATFYGGLNLSYVL